MAVPLATRDVSDVFIAIVKIGLRAVGLVVEEAGAFALHLRHALVWVLLVLLAEEALVEVPHAIGGARLVDARLLAQRLGHLGPGLLGHRPGLLGHHREEGGALLAARRHRLCRIGRHLLKS